MNNIQSLKLLFGGDFAPRGAYQELIARNSGDIFADARDLIAGSDFTIFNLEVPLCGEMKEITKAGPAIRANPEVLEALTSVGVDAVCLANNHIFDFGPQGLEQTLSALRNHDIRHVGAGIERPSAEAALRVMIRGRRISIFAFAEQEFNIAEDNQAGAAILDPLRVAPLLMAERNEADAVIVCIHGGNEYFAYPRPGLRRICQFMIEIGADAVIGHHPHVPGAYEIYREKPIVYSLGNLIFDTRNPPPLWDEGYFAYLDLRFVENSLENVFIDLIPYRQSINQGGLKLLDGEERKRFLARIEDMRENLENKPDKWLDAWERFVSSKQLQVLIDLSSPIRFPGFRHLMKFRVLRNLILPPSRRIYRQNLLRCESHRELVISALKNPMLDSEQ